MGDREMAFQLLPRDALVHNAVLRLHVVRLSVCLSVRLSVTLVDQDHKGWKSWKPIARTLSPTPSLFVAQRLALFQTAESDRMFFNSSANIATPPTSNSIPQCHTQKGLVPTFVVF